MREVMLESGEDDMAKPLKINVKKNGKPPIPYF